VGYLIFARRNAPFSALWSMNQCALSAGNCVQTVVSDQLSVVRDWRGQVQWLLLCPILKCGAPGGVVGKSNLDRDPLQV